MAYKWDYTDRSSGAEDTTEQFLSIDECDPTNSKQTNDNIEKTLQERAMMNLLQLTQRPICHHGSVPKDSGYFSNNTPIGNFSDSDSVTDNAGTKTQEAFFVRKKLKNHEVSEKEENASEETGKTFDHKCEDIHNEHNISVPQKQELDMLKHDLLSQTSSSSTKSSSSSTLPDVVSSSTSSDSHYSVVEDMTHRHENSLDNSRRSSMNTVREEDGNDQVFSENEGLPGNSDQESETTYNCEGTIKEEVYDTNTAPTSKKLHREFSTPGTVSDEKKESLQESARNEQTRPVIGRSVSYHPTRTFSQENDENFTYIEKRKIFSKTKSCSDLGSSLTSSKDDTSTTERRKSFKESGHGSSYSSSKDETEMDLEGHSQTSSVELDSMKNMKYNTFLDQKGVFNIEDFLSKYHHPFSDLDMDGASFEVNSEESVELDCNIMRIIKYDQYLDQKHVFNMEGFKQSLPQHYRPYFEESSHDQQASKQQHPNTKQNSKTHDEYAAELMFPIINENSKTHSELTYEQLHSFLQEDFKTRDELSNEEVETEMNFHDNFCLEQLNKLSESKNNMINHTEELPYNNIDLDREYREFRKTVKYSQLQERLKEGNYSLDSLAREIISDSGTDLETDSDIQDNSDECFYEQSWHKSPGEENLALLMASVKLCDSDTCEDVLCRKGKKLYNLLINGSPAVDSVKNKILEDLACHSVHCGAEWCPVPWCTFFRQQMDEHQCIAMVIANFYREYVYLCQLTIDTMEESKFISLDQGYESLPEDYYIIHRFNVSGNAYFAKESNTAKRVDVFSVVKKSQHFEENVAALMQLRNIQNENLVKLLWASVIQERDLYTTAKYEECKNLREHIKLYHADGLPAKVLFDQIKNLQKAMEFLHSNEVMYFNWLAEHVLYDQYGLKLCNFTTAISKKAMLENEDLPTDLIGRLPPFLIPPEFHENTMQFPHSDYWGFGCLIYELATGNHIHWEIRHCMPEQQMKQIDDNQIPSFCDISEDRVKLYIQNFLQLPKENRRLISLKI